MPPLLAALNHADGTARCLGIFILFGVITNQNISSCNLLGNDITKMISSFLSRNLRLIPLQP